MYIQHDRQGITAPIFRQTIALKMHVCDNILITGIFSAVPSTLENLQ